VFAEVGPDRVAAWVHPGPKRGTTPLLLLHGFGGTALYQWQHQMEAFAEERAVVVPDLLWFGESVSTSDDPSLEHQRRAVEALLDEVGAAQVDVVGLSYGGFVALALAQAVPGRVRSLTLVDSPGPAWSRERHQAMLERFGVERAAQLFVPKRPEDIDVLLALAVSDPPSVPRFAAREVIRTYYDPHRAALVRLLDHLEANLDVLVNAPAPVGIRSCVIWGADDPVFEPEVAPRLAGRLGAELRMLAGARHLSSADAPEAFNDALRGFLGEDPVSPHGAA
jgi:pimeloyl-ACP methyl ester carboxylesterase